MTNSLGFRGHISTIRTENTAKSGLFKVENNAERTSKHLQNNFQKPLKTGFLTLKMVKMPLSEGENLTKKLILEVIYHPFELKIPLKLALLTF